MLLMSMWMISASNFELSKKSSLHLKHPPSSSTSGTYRAYPPQINNFRGPHLTLLRAYMMTKGSRAAHSSAKSNQAAERGSDGEERDTTTTTKEEFLTICSSFLQFSHTRPVVVSLQLATDAIIAARTSKRGREGERERERDFGP